MHRQIPNALTLSRFVAAGAIALLYFYQYRWSVLPVVLLAALSDVFDGRLARRWQCTSAFGARVDPYADKALCWTVTLILYHALPREWYIVLPLIGVMLLYDLGLIAIRLAYPERLIPTNRYAKYKTVALMTSIGFLYLYVLTAVPVSLAAGVSLAWIAACLALFSAAHYLRAYGLVRLPSMP